jgi:TolB-like protein
MRNRDFLGHGLAEELIHTLAGVPGLRVPARTSSFAYQARDFDVRRIASELDVGTVLEGSVRAAGEHIRNTAQLIDG